MSRQKLVGIVAAGLGIALVAAALYAIGPPNRANLDNFNQIKRQMNEGQVIALLGRPGDYRTGPTQEIPMQTITLLRPMGRGKRPGFIGEIWETDYARIRVSWETVGGTTQISEATYSKMKPLNESAWVTFLRDSLP